MVTSIDLDYSWKECFTTSCQWWENKFAGMELQVESGVESPNTFNTKKKTKRKDTVKKIHNRATEVLHRGTHECQKDIDHVNLLKACAKDKDLKKGSRIHSYVLKRGLLEKNIYLANTIVSFYVKCGALSQAAEVLQQLCFRDVVSWNALITGYVHHGHAPEALNYICRLKCEGLCPDAFTHVSALKACGIIKGARKGKELHTQIIQERLLEKDIFVSTALVDMYVKCGGFEKALEVFNTVVIKNIVLWNALIAGALQQGLFKRVLHDFSWMQLEGFYPNSVTFVCALNACGVLGAIETGKNLHAQIYKLDSLEKNIFVGNALVHMYAKCGELLKAQSVFDRLQIKDVVTWNVLISGYTHFGHGEDAIHCLERMCDGGFIPDAVTFLSILKACGCVGAADKGKEVHAEIVREGLLVQNSLLGNALVDMYAKCTGLTKAQEAFDQLKFHDAASWNTLIMGYALHGHGEAALDCFQQMQEEGVPANRVTLLAVLKACGGTGAVHIGEEIHAWMKSEGLLANDILLSTTLVDMYAKCGAVHKAQEVFDETRSPNVISWNALMAGYAQLGNDNGVVGLLDRMLGEGIEPDLVTFSIVLSSCNHSGLLDRGHVYLEMMNAFYNINPTLEHHICMVDLYGRAGNLDKVMAIVKRMPSSDYFSVCSSLLGACQKWGNVKLGWQAFEHLVRLTENNVAAYVCMRNIYAAAALQEKEGM